MTNLQPTDYAALIRAASASTPTIPEWLQIGEQIISSKHGTGKVISLLGSRLIVKIPGYSVPVQFKDWQKSLELGEVQPLTPPPIIKETLTDEQTSHSEQVSIAEIEGIAQPKFRAIADKLQEMLTVIDISPPVTGEPFALPSYLSSGLQTALKHIGIRHLYSHQIESLEQLRMGKDLSIVTPTASGKTLCYNPAIVDSCLSNPHTTALYIFPLKALALDQVRKLQQLAVALPAGYHLKVCQMSGDTAFNQRKQLFIPDPPHILAVNPDLLHYQLDKVRRISEWQPWREFLRRLRWVVIDESHTYIGAFGAHFANLMRRLRRAVDSVGGNSDQLQFICSSATIGNPTELALRFSGRTQTPERLHLIQRSGAERAERTILCLAPSNTANLDTCKIILSWLEQDLSGIVFCNSRAAVKRLLALIQRETERQGVGALAQKIAIFYGSLKSEHRYSVIEGLRTGRLKIVLSTSALEAGLDLPELDCCLIRGYPGSIMSFRQRIGRAGRQNPGLVIFLPIAQNPLDQYYGYYPEQLLNGAVESAAFNPDYPTVLGKHLECCCTESGLPLSDVGKYFGSQAGAIASELLEQDILRLSSTSTLWGHGNPHKSLQLRGGVTELIELIDKNTGETVEEMSRDVAHREVFPGAIYTASDGQGCLITYQCESLNEDTAKAILIPLTEDPEAFTQVETDVDIKPLTKLTEPLIMQTAIAEGRLRLTLEWGEISSLVTGYKLLTRKYQLTCINSQCRNHHQPLSGDKCSLCCRQLRLAEITQVKQEVIFEQPYQTKYQAPCVKVEINKALKEAISALVSRLKDTILAKPENSLSSSLSELWSASTEFIALHTMAHQIQQALPLVVLSSSHDVDCIVEQEDSKTFGYFFDTCDGGNGAAEAIFQQIPVLAARANHWHKHVVVSMVAPVA